MLADWVLSMRGLVCHWLDCSYSAAALVLALVLDPVRHARVLHRKHFLTCSHSPTCNESPLHCCHWLPVPAHLQVTARAGATTAVYAGC